MEWPPMITHPTSAALARPPRKIDEITLGRTRSVGNPTMLSAVNGRPPMAKMSESEFAAAICPYENGSSTIGVKKSTVCTRARCRSRRYTPASSKVFELTSTLRSDKIGSCGKTCRRACWLNFEAHPAHDEREVSFRICSRDIEITPFPTADCGLRISDCSSASLITHRARAACGLDRGNRYGKQFIGLGIEIVSLGSLQELPRKDHLHPICRFVALFFHYAKLGNKVCL